MLMQARVLILYDIWEIRARISQITAPNSDVSDELRFPPRCGIASASAVKGQFIGEQRVVISEGPLPSLLLIPQTEAGIPHRQMVMFKCFQPIETRNVELYVTAAMCNQQDRVGPSWIPDHAPMKPSNAGMRQVLVDIGIRGNAFAG